jgi:hypothetical protein
VALALSVLVFAAPLTTGCGVEPGAEPVASITSQLTESSVVSNEMLRRRWPNGIIPVRFDPGFTFDKAKVRAALFGAPEFTIASGVHEGKQACLASTPCTGWGAANAVRFVDCDVTDCSGYNHTVYLIGDINGQNSTNRKRGYRSLKTETHSSCASLAVTSDCRDRACDYSSGEACVFDIWLKDSNRTYFMWNVAHELGHMLGFNHEQFRPDRESYIDMSGCPDDFASWEESEPNFLAFIGSYDLDSVMHYPVSMACYTSKPGKPIGDKRPDLPSPKDLAKLQLLYGVRGDWLRNGDWCIGGGRTIHTGDFNKDGRVDLLCHSATAGTKATGRKWIDYSNTSGQFNGTNWHGGTGKFCWGGGRRLHVGDFNNDGRDDILCHNRDIGSITIDYASSGGELNGQNWPANGVFAWSCQGQNARVHVGDFNGDGHDDLLCHDTQTGVRKIDLADSSGRFGSFNWTSEDTGQRRWCHGANQRLLIGDFDGDGSDDALCHDTQTGHRLIDFSFKLGDLKGTNWDSLADGANAFCWGQDRKLHAADVNGDGLADLLCHNERIGSVSVDRAEPSASWRDGKGLRGKDSFYDLAFCNARDARLLTGAFGPGDRRADLLCHNTATGHKAILYARAGGQFRIPPGF